MQDNNENNVNVEKVVQNDNVQSQNVGEVNIGEQTPVMNTNITIGSNLNNKKSNKKIIIMIAIVVLVIVVGIALFFIFSKDDDASKENNSSSNNNVTDVDDKDKLDDVEGDNSSVILANLKLSDDLNNEKITDKKYYIYKTNDGSIIQYVILPDSNNNPYDSYKLVDNYVCSDNCTFFDNYFLHEDGSLEYFNFKNGKISKLKLVEKYNTIDNNLKVSKYSDGTDLFYYGEFKGEKSFGLVEDNLFQLSFGNWNLILCSSNELIEKGSYMLAKYNDEDSIMEYEIYANVTKKLGYNKEEIAGYNDEITLNYVNNNYVIRSDTLDCDYLLILNSKMEKIVGYYNYISDCLLNDGEYYCYLNDFNLDGTASAKLSKYDQSGKETIIKKYKTIVAMNDNFVLMALTSGNNYEIYDVKNDKVLYSFDKLTSSQEQCYCSFFEHNNYFDEKTNMFHAFVDDESLTEKDFPNENHDPEKDNYVNMFGYEYTYNVKTGEGKVTKKASYTEEE